MNLIQYQFLLIAILFCFVWPLSKIYGGGIRYTGLIEGSIQNREDSNSSFSSSSTIIDQSYRIGFKGNIIDPKFLVYFIGTSFSDRKTKYVYYNANERNFGLYDIAFRLFPEKKNSFRFFLKRNKIQSIFDKYDNLDGYNNRVGLRWQFVGRRYPTMSLSLQRYHLKAMKRDISNILTEFNLSQQHGNMSYVRLNYKSNIETNNLTGSKRSYVDLRFEGKSKIGKSSRIINYINYYSRDLLKLYRSTIRLDINYGKKNNAQLFYNFYGQNYFSSSSMTNKLYCRMRRNLLEGFTLQSNLSIQNISQNTQSLNYRTSYANSSTGVIYQKYWKFRWIKLDADVNSNVNYQVKSSNRGEGFFMNGIRVEFQSGNYNLIHIAGGSSVNSQYNSRNNTNIHSFGFSGDIFIGLIPRLSLRSRYDQRLSQGDIYQEQDIPAEESNSPANLLLYNNNYYIGQLTVTKWDTELRIIILRSLSCSAGYEINDRRTATQNTSKRARIYISYRPSQNMNLRVTYNKSSYIQFDYASHWLDSRLDYHLRRLSFSLEFTNRFSDGLYPNQSKSLKLSVKRQIGENTPWGDEYSSSGRTH